MTRGHRTTDQTFYDRTVVGRARSIDRRTKRVGASLLALSVMTAGAAVGAAPAQAVAYGGFSTVATAIPLQIELFEPTIPVPTEPQSEIDLSYTRVIGDSGPFTRARSSALWPGAGIGEGFKTFGEQLGLPAQLTEGGYPVQANAVFPGEPNEEAQEFFPGMIGRVSAGDKRTLAKVTYTSSDVSDGETSKGSKASAEPAPSPLGALSALIDFDGMTSVSSTDYDGDTVVATATSRIGELRLLAGVIKLTGVNVVSKVSSSLDGGAQTSKVVDIGGMTIAGQKFAYGPDGFTAAGTIVPIPGFPDSAAELLEMLGVAIELPTPKVTKEGAVGSVSSEAVRITIDTKPLRTNLPALPIDDLINGLPLPPEANILKGILLSINTIAPKIVLHVGAAHAAATTVSQADLGEGSITDTPPLETPSTGTDSGLGFSETPTLDAEPVEDLGVVNDDATEAIAPVAQGLPPLGSVPMLLLIGGLLLASGAGWYLRRAGLLLFGGPASCPSGLKVGVPDLRKA